MGDVERLADEIAASAPKPSHAAAAQSSAQADARDPRWKDLRDKHGHPFDPTLHQTNRDGSPKLSRAGRLQGLPGRPLPRRGGSRVADGPPLVSTVPPLGDTGAGQRELDADGAGDAGTELSAQVVVDSATEFCALMLGPEWNPRREKIGGKVYDERAQLISAVARYFEATGVRDVPPGVLLAMVVSVYVAPRLRAPQTRSRLAAAWLRVRGWFGRRRRAPADPGNDGQRQEHASEAASAAA